MDGDKAGGACLQKQRVVSIEVVWVEVCVHRSDRPLLSTWQTVAIVSI